VTGRSGRFSRHSEVFRRTFWSAFAVPLGPRGWRGCHTPITPGVAGVLYIEEIRGVGRG
jgi:hypothetical protein